MKRKPSALVSRILRSRVVVAVVSSLATAAVVGVGAVFAVNVPDANDIIHAAYDTKTGIMRLVDSAASPIRPGEDRLFWNQKGVKGDQGIQGLKGETGATGATGPQGAKGDPGVMNATSPLALANGTLSLSQDGVTKDHVGPGAVRGGQDSGTGPVVDNEILDNTIVASDLNQGFLEGLANDAEVSGKIQELKDELNGTPDDTTWGEGSDLVSWYKLKDIPAGFADGTDNAGNNAVTTAEITNGTIKGEDVTTVDADALTGANIKDGTITSADLATAGAVNWTQISGVPAGFADGVDDTGGGSLTDGSVTTAKIADGAVTSNKQTANAGAYYGGVHTIFGAGSVRFPSSGTETLLSIKGGQHKVLVLGQARLALVCGTVANPSLCGSDAQGGATIRVWDTTSSGQNLVGIARYVALYGPGAESFPMIRLATPSSDSSNPTVAADHTYQLEVEASSGNFQNGTIGVNVTSTDLTAVDLGLAP